MIFLLILTEIKSILEDKSKNNHTYYFKQVIFSLLYFAAGVLMAGINDLGTFSPFGVSFVCAVKPKYIIPAAAGAAAGYILTQDSVTALRYLAAIVSAAVTVRLLFDIKKVKKYSLIPPFTSFFTLIVTSAVMLISSASEPKAFLVFFGEAALGFVCAYFFSSSIASLELFKAQEGFYIKDISLLSLTAFVFMLSLEGISLFGLSFSRIIATLSVLLLSYIYKQSGAAISSIAATLVFSVSKDVGVLGLLGCAAGFSAGLFSEAGRLMMSAVYFSVYLVMFILNSGDEAQLYLVLESLVACIVFLLVKKDRLEELSRLLTVRNEPEQTEAHRKLVADRLSAYSRAVVGMTKAIAAASGILKYENAETQISIYSQIRERACTQCRHMNRCWDKNFNDTKRALDEMSEILKGGGMINKSNMPKYLSGCCVNSERLADGFNRCYLNFAASQSNQRKTEKIRQITAEQFEYVYTVLGEAAKPLKHGLRFDTGRADRISEMLLNRFCIKADSVLCFADKNDRLSLELTFSEKPSKLNPSELKRSLEEVCETTFDKPVVVEDAGKLVLYACRKTKYRVEIAAARVVADKQKHCGDNFESFYDGKGNYIVILSDGMGTGLRASVDSSLAVCVCGKLLRAGFDCESALKLTNCALLLKSVDESLATVDILKINLYTGKTELYKAGAAVSFIKRAEKITEIRQASMPMGILSEVNFSLSEHIISENDIVMLASDGAFEYSEVALKNSLAVSFDEGVEEIAERSASRAKKASKGKRNDDITVITVRVVKNS